ncbi:MAG TPA: hypothetical protein VNL17_03345 [Verrucomicrobiae bacterium]|nr:hypothetical protein [Verrucomicrobiae bacterium]
MGSSLKVSGIGVWLAAVITCVIELLVPVESHAQILYNITFGQFSPGTTYTNASGPPNDFSAYAPGGSNPSGVFSVIFPAFLNLKNQPLVCNNAGQGVGNFLMQIGNVSSNAVTLSMQLQLDSVVGAKVTFGQSGPPGSNVTSITLNYPETTTNIVAVQSVDGPTNSLTALYSFATSLVRSNLQNINFSLNLPARTFSLSINGVSFANNAPIGSSHPINQAGISIGDTDGLGNGGSGGIDNVVLTAGSAASISGIFFSGADIMLGLTTSTNAHYDVQTTTNLVAGTWSTILSNIAGSGGLTNFNCGPSAAPQQFFRIDAHP